MGELISLEKAFSLLDGAASGFTVQAEDVSTMESRGRVLAKDAASRLSLPPFNKSAMDGYAVMAEDERDEYRVIEHVPAGETPSRSLEPGAAMKVMTGAPVPEGAGKVIMVEHTDRGSETVKVNKHGGKANICIKGEDVCVGQAVMEAGSKLSALAAANLVSCGISHVSVRRKPRMAVIGTGDEVVDSIEKIEPGRIMDANGPMLAGLAAENDIEITRRSLVSDDPEALAAEISSASDAADIVVLSGGVSAGDFDFVPAAMADAGFTIHFKGVAVQPGKPVTFGSTEDKFVLGLPGNPVSVFLGFQLFVLRVASLVCGAGVSDKSFKVRLSGEFKRRRATRTLFRPAVIGREGCVEPVTYHGSAHLLALCAADGFVRIPEGVDRLPRGAEVAFYPMMLA